YYLSWGTAEEVAAQCRDGVERGYTVFYLKVGVDAVAAMRPIVLGRDPFEMESIARDVFVAGAWQFQAMTGNFAFAGIDMALWDLCAKACGQPLYRLLGGALREAVDYFYYLSWGTEDEIAGQCRDGVERGYSVFYLKVGVDAAAEEAMLAAVRRTIGPGRKIRIDANQAWTVPQAARLLGDWHEKFELDFVEAPVPIDPALLMADLKRRVPVPLCVNEGLWRAADAYRIIDSRCADYLCFSAYWVGTLRRFQSLCHAAEAKGWQVCKHTHGELGLAAAAGQHLMLALPNACDGHQQTAQLMADDILAEPLPIATGPRWGRIEAPGLGVEVDERKLARYHRDFLDQGQFPPYGDRFPSSA
ncbi:MAG TPA: mandelate racemase/muconate lactonizing enzyme family protein, partial [Geminicoccaceae bacterium]|nr:mandelate racemase/muconate lactonizing enzyme family protein [Geminicoccaceae bacterium]